MQGYGLMRIISFGILHQTTWKIWRSEGKDFHLIHKKPCFYGQWVVSNRVNFRVDSVALQHIFESE